MATHIFKGTQIHSGNNCKWIEAFPLQVTDSDTLARVLVDEIAC